MAETVFAVTQTPPDRAPTALRVNAELLRTERRVEIVAPEESHQSVLSTGTVISGLSVRIVNDAGAVLPEGRVGIIAVAGDCLFDGYFKLEEETRSKLRDGWYRTGDLGFLRGGELYVTGRIQDLIIVHGKNYYAHELEYLVSQMAGVRPGRAVAVGWFRPDIGTEEIVIIAEHDSESGVDRGALAPAIKQTLLNSAGLLAYDVHVVNAGWLVKTTSGKISRRENLGKYLVDVGRATAA